MSSPASSTGSPAGKGAPRPADRPPTGRPPTDRPSPLTRRLAFSRTLLPPLIVLVVVLYESLVRRLSLELGSPLLGSPALETTLHVLFYGLAGPLATYFTLRWIADGARLREQQERELRRLYAELSAQNARMGAVQQLMREVAGAPDLETVLSAAAQGAVRATGAEHARLSVGGLEVSSASDDTLLSAPSADLRELSLPLITGPDQGGRLELYFGAPPGQQTEALCEAIAAEVGSALSSAQQRSRDLITLYEVDQSIRAERNMRRLLARVTGTVAGRVGAGSRAAYLRDSDGLLHLEYALVEEGGSERVLARGGPVPPFVQRVARGGVPLLAGTDGAGEDEAGEVLPGARSALGLPMLGEDGLVGVIVLASSQSGAFSGMRVPLLALLASQATLAVRNARAYLHSEEVAIGEERSRIAREIHDGVAQSLAFCAIRLDVVGRTLAGARSSLPAAGTGSPPALEASLDKAAQEVAATGTLLREQIREVRRSIFALRPIDLERFGLLETARRYVQDFGEQNGVRARLEVAGDISLAPGDEAVVFRILQESLNNVAKHARAGSVEVRLCGGDWVTLSVQDDGAGFDPQAVSGRVSSAGGLGLGQMRERVEARGGRYRIESAPGAGTRVEASLPQR